jgi:hypothetical protein
MSTANVRCPWLRSEIFGSQIVLLVPVAWRSTTGAPPSGPLTRTCVSPKGVLTITCVNETGHSARTSS